VPKHAPTGVTKAGVTTASPYDANGNMLTGPGAKIMTYDAENRPLSVTFLGKRTCYVYGADGKRLKKVEGLPPTQDCTALPANANATVYFGAVEVRNWLILGQEQVLTYPHPAVKLVNGTTPSVATYLHRDGLSSVRAITSAAGVKIESALYKPFGEQSEWLLPGNPSPETKGWIGERYDADAGLQYLNARYYDPELSLFLQPDWFEVTTPGVGTNRFSYSFNDPINKWDPNGNQTKDDLEREHDLYSKAIDEAQDAIANGEDISPDDLAELYGIRDDLQSQIDDYLINEQADLTNILLDATKEIAGGTKLKVGKKIADQLLTGVRKNYVAGARRQAGVVAEQKKLYPDASVQTEQYLRGADGKILKGPDGTGRRLDVVVIQDGKVVGHPVEVTSMTADKTAQLAKESAIHNSGTVFVRDRTTGNLVEITGLVSRLERRP
jgi:RHS repeat-associated protein